MGVLTEPSWRRAIGRWFQLLGMPAADVLAIAEAFVLLGGFQLAMRIPPLCVFSSRLASRLPLRQPRGGFWRQAPGRAARRASTVANAVATASRHTPWESACLVRSLAAVTMLRRRRVPCALFLGVRRGNRGAVEAHAWVRTADGFVSGAPDHDSFTVVGAFGRSAAAGDDQGGTR